MYYQFKGWPGRHFISFLQSWFYDFLIYGRWLSSLSFHWQLECLSWSVHDQRDPCQWPHTTDCSMFTIYSLKFSSTLRKGATGHSLVPKGIKIWPGLPLAPKRSQHQLWMCYGNIWIQNYPFWSSFRDFNRWTTFGWVFFDVISSSTDLALWTIM
jgi:hypothetical protein